MGSALIASILDEMKLKASNFNLDELGLLKVELGLLKTFFLCVRTFSNHVSTTSSASFLSSLEDTVREYGQGFLQTLSLRTEGRSSPADFSSRVSNFRGKIEFFKGEISGYYLSLSDCFLQPVSSLPVGEQLLEFMESLGEDLENILNLASIHQEKSRDSIEPLEENLRFLKNFVRFAVLGGVEQRQLENLLIHSHVMSVDAAQFSCISWFQRNEDQVFDEMELRISELVEKMKPVRSLVRETYIQVLKSAGSSLADTTEMDKNILGDFVDSLQGNLRDLLLDHGTSFMMYGKHQLQMLYGGLKVLKTILKQQPDKFNGLHAQTKDLVGAVINEAGILVFSAYVNHMDDGSAEEMFRSLCDLLKSIELIKAEVAENYPAKSTFSFPTSDEMKFVDLLAENLKRLESHKSDLLDSSVKKVVQMVQEDLVFLRSFMENIAEQHNHHPKLQAFWDHAMETAYEAEFVVDSLLVGDVSYSSIQLLNTVAEDIKLVKAEAFEIDDKKYISEAQKASKTSSHEPLEGTTSAINDVVVGFDDEAKAIINQLTRGSTQLDIVSIVGMPGLGKTTLARKVYHDAFIARHFYILAWCGISQVYNRKDLLIRILACNSAKQPNEYAMMSEDDLALELYRRLKRKRYLIVLDDVWDIEAWRALERSFPNDVNGSRILLTSRLHDVALLIRPKSKPYPLRRLTGDESWQLLQKKLVGVEDYPPALHVLGKQIATNCNGLPITVVLISGVLSSLDQPGWEEVAKRLSSSVVYDTDDCRDVLDLSYRHLPNFLKPCLLYFGAFVQDLEIPIQRLMRLWIAEGFVQENEQESLEDIAEAYTMALISRSLIMVAERGSTGRVKTCRIHDLLREFCAARANEENFVQVIHGYNEILDFDGAPDLRRLCIFSRQKNFVKPRLFCPRLRSLLFFSLNGMGFEFPRDVSFFLRLKLLRVLDLEQINLGSVFPSEATLIQLRYLAIQGSMSDLPPSIVNLSNLEFFLVRTQSPRFFFPSAVWSMQALRYVYGRGLPFDFRLDGVELESSIGLLNLETVSILNLYLGKSMEKVLRKLPNIRKLKCCLLESEDSALEREKAVVMDFLDRVESLKLQVIHVDVRHMEFHFPSNLKKLSLVGFLSSILSQIGKLPNLEVLKLIGDRHPDEPETWEMEEGDFPNLKFLRMEVDFVRWEGSGDHLACLEKLIFLKCEALEELPSCLSYISTLELIQVIGCSDAVVNLVREVREEQHSLGNDELKVHVVETDW